jgi:hypothetical protein
VPLFFCGDKRVSRATLLVFPGGLFQQLQRIVPAALQRGGYQAIGWVNFLISPLCKLRLVLCPFDLHPPLAVYHIVAALQLLQSLVSYLYLRRFNHLQRTLAYRIVKQI